MRSRRFGEAFFADDRLAELDPLARIFFLGLLACADREGRLEDRPRKLKALVLPFDNADPDSMLADLARLGLLRRYEADGRRLLAIHGFRDDGSVAYQRPHPNETASTLPPPPAEDNHGTPPRSTKGDPRGDSVSVTVTADREEHQGGSPEAGSPGVTIPLKDGTTYQPTAAQLAEWRAAFPGVDVRRELLAAGAWAKAKPERRKTRRGAPAFCVNWLKNATPTAPTRSAAAARDAAAARRAREAQLAVEGAAR